MGAKGLGGKHVLLLAAGWRCWSGREEQLGLGKPRLIPTLERGAGAQGGGVCESEDLSSVTDTHRCPQARMRLTGHQFRHLWKGVSPSILVRILKG